MLRNYLKVAWKVFGRNKFFTFVSLFGITLTLAILIIVTALVDEFIYPKYPKSSRDKMVFVDRIWMHNEDQSNNWMGAGSINLLTNYMSKLKTPQKMGFASRGGDTNTFIGDKKLQLHISYTDATFWELHQFDFLEGGPLQQQHIDNQDKVVVINETTRDSYFGKEERATGKTLITGNVSYKVVGVVRDAPMYQFYVESDLYTPYTLMPNWNNDRLMGGAVGFLLAEDRAGVKEIKAEIQSIIPQIPIPERPASSGISVLKIPAGTFFETIAQGIMSFNTPNAVQVFMSVLIGLFLLFISLPTLNLVNLNSSRIMDRASEIGVRKAFGATRSTLAIQFIVENVVLTLIGGAIGLILAYISLQVLESSQLIPHAEFGINFKVFGIAIGMCVVFGVLSGVLPALRMSKLSIVKAIKGGQL